MSNANEKYTKVKIDNNLWLFYPDKVQFSGAVGKKAWLEEVQQTMGSEKVGQVRIDGQHF